LSEKGSEIAIFGSAVDVSAGGMGVCWDEKVPVIVRHQNRVYSARRVHQASSKVVRTKHDMSYFLFDNVN
jgi:hypothetical protein